MYATQSPCCLCVAGRSVARRATHHGRDVSTLPVALLSAVPHAVLPTPSHRPTNLITTHCTAAARSTAAVPRHVVTTVLPVIMSPQCLSRPVMGMKKNKDNEEE